MSAEHHIKLKEQYVRPILEGRMLYQLRFNDRNYQQGDTVRFHVVNINGLVGDHPSPVNAVSDYRYRTPDNTTFAYCTPKDIAELEEKRFQVECVMTERCLEPGFVVFSIKEIIADRTADSLFG